MLAVMTTLPDMTFEVARVAFSQIDGCLILSKSVIFA